MATHINTPVSSYFAGEDLSNKQFYIVKQTADDTVMLADSATANLVGTLENDPKSGEGAGVLHAGGGRTGKVKLGGVVSRGARLTSDSDGKAVATTTEDNVVIGIALQEGVANDVIEYAPSHSIVAPAS